MATLTYNAAYSPQNWTGTVNINYTAVYDPVTNRTTVTFEDCTHVYFGRSGYGTSYTTNITVTAKDNTSSKGTATITSASNATTNGGTKTFTDTPSPVSIVVQHASGAGVKSITIAGSTSITGYMASSTSTQTTGTGNGSTSVTMVTTYALSVKASTGATVTVQRTASSYVSAGALASGAMLYPRDVLKVSYSTSVQYEITAATLNGSAISSGATHTVSANVTVVVSTRLAGLAYIDSSTSLEAYQAYIDNGTGWDGPYAPYIDNGSGWDLCS